jgi:riboflavin synthase
MFTGIIEETGTVAAMANEGTNKSFWIASDLSSQLKIDQSIAHDGVCLTVEAVQNNSHKVTAVAETLQKTTLHSWAINKAINLERCLLPSSRLDGHFVQGHVDAVGTITELKNLQGSWQLTCRFSKNFAPLIIEKGSITLNGISLTAFNVGMEQFDIAIIPYTYWHTNLQFMQEGATVNLEFDVLGKYITRWHETKAGKQQSL